MTLLVPAVFGAWAWWSEFGVACRASGIAACLLAAAATGVSVSIGVRPTDDVPWGRIGLVAGAIGLTCLLAAIRNPL